MSVRSLFRQNADPSELRGFFNELAQRLPMRGHAGWQHEEAQLEMALARSKPEFYSKLYNTLQLQEWTNGPIRRDRDIAIARRREQCAPNLLLQDSVPAGRAASWGIFSGSPWLSCFGGLFLFSFGFSPSHEAAHVLLKCPSYKLLSQKKGDICENR